jgi:hypothetical protein
MITTGATVCDPNRISNPCDLTLGNQERAATYYAVATNAHGRVDLCTGRLEPCWRSRPPFSISSRKAGDSAHIAGDTTYKQERKMNKIIGLQQRSYSSRRRLSRSRSGTLQFIA